MKYITIVLFSLLAIGCQKNNQSSVKDGKATVPKGYYQAPTLTVTGDFNGDGIQDVLIQDIADSNGVEVKYIPETPAAIENDTTNEGWYKYIEFYSKLKYRTRLHTKNLKSDALYFNNCQGLYCLINVGNLNNSKGDEIALVIDRLDQSRHNYVNLFTLCNGVWRKVFTYSVHEDAFDYKRGDVAILKNIPEALEFKDGQWKYYDYMDMPYDNIEDVGNMLPLKVPSCSENISLPLSD